MNLNKLKSLSGDASFRKFYRHNNIIIVVSKKETRKNLLIYDAINKILIKNKINAPKLVVQNCAGDQVTFNPPFNSPISFTISNNALIFFDASFPTISGKIDNPS